MDKRPVSRVAALDIEKARNAIFRGQEGLLRINGFIVQYGIRRFVVLFLLYTVIGIVKKPGPLDRYCSSISST